MISTGRRVGIPGQGVWEDQDGVWHFEDETSYYDAPENGDGTRPQSSAANHHHRE